MAKDKNWSSSIGAIAAIVGAVASTSTLSVTAPHFFLGMAALSAEASSAIPTVLAQKESAAAYVAQGVAFAQQKDWREAETSFRKAIALNPNYAEAYNHLGNALGERSETMEMIAAYQKAISLNPNYAIAYSNLGVVLDEQGKIAEAIAAHQKAISLNPNDARATTTWEFLCVSRRAKQ
jgi:tetratricopeptide (TPR) repeat protein